MNRDKFSETGKMNIKCAACTESMSASKLCSFSKMMQKKSVTEREDLAFTETKDFETQTHQREKYDNLVYKKSIFSLPTFIRVRATDREGNTIEVTY